MKSHLTIILVLLCTVILPSFAGSNGHSSLLDFKNLPEQIEPLSEILFTTDYTSLKDSDQLIFNSTIEFCKTYEELIFDYLKISSIYYAQFSDANSQNTNNSEFIQKEYNSNY